MRIEHVLHIEASPAEVWALTIDVESLPAISPTFTDVTLIGEPPLEVGSEVRIKQPAQRPRIWAVTELEPEVRFQWSTKAFGTTMSATHELVGTDAGTSNTLAVDIEGRLSSVVGALLRRPLAKAIATENQGLKKAAES